MVVITKNSFENKTEIRRLFEDERCPICENELHVIDYVQTCVNCGFVSSEPPVAIDTLSLTKESALNFIFEAPKHRNYRLPLLRQWHSKTRMIEFQNRYVSQNLTEYIRKIVSRFHEIDRTALFRAVEDINCYFLKIPDTYFESQSYNITEIVLFLLYNVAFKRSMPLKAFIRRCCELHMRQNYSRVFEIKNALRAIPALKQIVAGKDAVVERKDRILWKINDAFSKIELECAMKKQGKQIISATRAPINICKEKMLQNIILKFNSMPYNIWRRFNPASVAGFAIYGTLSKYVIKDTVSTACNINNSTFNNLQNVLGKYLQPLPLSAEVFTPH